METGVYLHGYLQYEVPYGTELYFPREHNYIDFKIQKVWIFVYDLKNKLVKIGEKFVNYIEE